MIRENKTVIKGISNSEFWGEIDSDNDLVNLENYWRDKLPE
jgi:hypothetical protein